MVSGVGSLCVVNRVGSLCVVSGVGSLCVVNRVGSLCVVNRVGSLCVVSGVGSLCVVVQKIQRPIVHKWVKFNPGLGILLAPGSGMSYLLARPAPIQMHSKPKVRRNYLRNHILVIN